MDVQAALTELRRPPQNTTDYHLLTLAEPLLRKDTSENDDNEDGKRTSNASSASSTTAGIPNATPLALEQELEHYRALFTKLRFNYISQVTKEKFLRAVIGDPPFTVETKENVALEQRLLGVKATLKEQKVTAEKQVDALEVQARDLSARYENLQAQIPELRALPGQIEELQTQVAELKAEIMASPRATTVYEHAEHTPAAELQLSLETTSELLATREEEEAALDAQMAALEETMQRKQDELERRQNETQRLEARKKEALAKAREAVKRREEQGSELEERGRWAKAQEGILRNMLEMEA